MSIKALNKLKIIAIVLIVISIASLLFHITDTKQILKPMYVGLDIIMLIMGIYYYFIAKSRKRNYRIHPMI